MVRYSAASVNETKSAKVGGRGDGAEVACLRLFAGREASISILLGVSAAQQAFGAARRWAAEAIDLQPRWEGSLRPWRRLKTVSDNFVSCCSWAGQH
jgi:hypothetical protein